MSIKFFAAASPAALRAALAPFGCTATVEAEYGEAVVEGTALTMAHHGPRAGQPAPCSYPNGVDRFTCRECGGRPEAIDTGRGCARCGFDGFEDVEAVGLSHVDLDTLGGCAAILGRKPEAPGFWALAEHVDLRGPHRLAEAGASPEDVARLHAFWAWSQANRVNVPREGHVDVTEAVLAGVEAIERILAGDAELLAAGEAHAAGEAALNAASFVRAEGGVILRRSAQFVNHLYAAPDGTPAAAVVALNERTGAVTVSFADHAPAGGAVAIVQGLWGSLAGGHLGIAGSPRGQTMTEADAEAAFEATTRRMAGGMYMVASLTPAAGHAVVTAAYASGPGPHLVGSDQAGAWIAPYEQGVQHPRTIVPGLVPLIPGAAEHHDSWGDDRSTTVFPIIGTVSEAAEARAALIAAILTDKAVPVSVEVGRVATADCLGLVHIRGGAAVHSPMIKHPSASGGRDWCLACGRDTTGARQGFDCCHCGSN